MSRVLVRKWIDSWYKRTIASLDKADENDRIKRESAEGQKLLGFVPKKTKEHKDGETSITDRLFQELFKVLNPKKAVVEAQRAYNELYEARSLEERVIEVLSITEKRELAEMARAASIEKYEEDMAKYRKKLAELYAEDTGSTVLPTSRGFPDATWSQLAERYQDEMTMERLMEPRKKGLIEIELDKLLSQYKASRDVALIPEIETRIGIIRCKRKMRHIKDVQKLRVSTDNRVNTYNSELGIQDPVLDYCSASMNQMEKVLISTIDEAMFESPNSAFYAYLKDYTGVGPMMAGTIVGEMEYPTCFGSIGKAWAYCGLAVVGHNQDTGEGGRCQRRITGQTANWNATLKSSLLGVLADGFIKAQTKYLPDSYFEPGYERSADADPERCRNIKVYRDYKLRIVTANNLIPENARVYNKKGREKFRGMSDDKIRWFSKDGNPKGDISKLQIRRRSGHHLEKMARRYMIKMFIKDIINKWREVCHLEPLLDYNEEKLRGGRRHGESRDEVRY